MGLELEGTLSSEDCRIAGRPSTSCAKSSFRALDDAFLQTQTRIWLGEVLQLRLDDQISISEVLADGELLFEVSKVVWSLLLVRHTELRHEKAYENEPFACKKTSGRYMPYSNVDSFLKICKILGLTGIDLFSPSDVVEKRNTRRVCMCIRSFSKKARSQYLNFPDFDVVTYTVPMPTDMVGFLRRSLELSQNCLPGVSTLHDGAKKKFWEDFVLAQRSGAEVSDDLEFGNMALQHKGLISDRANLSSVNSSSEGLILSPILINDDGVSSQFQSDAKREDKNAHLESIFRIYYENQEKDYVFSRSSSSSIYSSTGSKSGASPADAADLLGKEHGSPGFRYADPDLERNSPILKNEMNESTPVGGFISPNMAISISPDSSHFLSDGESSMCYVYKSASSCGSNSIARTINIGNVLDSVGDNMEVQLASPICAESDDYSEDIIGCKEVIPDTIHEVAVSFKQLKRTASIESCLTDESPESISQSSHPSCAHYDSKVYHAEHEIMVRNPEILPVSFSVELIKDGRNLENVASNNDSEEKVNTSTKRSKEKSQKKLLLKSILGGTAVFGLVFLLLRGRQSDERSVGEEKTGDKLKGSRLSSKKAQKENTAKVNGVYPPEKLKFGL